MPPLDKMWCIFEFFCFSKYLTIVESTFDTQREFIVMAAKLAAEERINGEKRRQAAEKMEAYEQEKRELQRTKAQDKAREERLAQKLKEAQKEAADADAERKRIEQAQKDLEKKIEEAEEARKQSWWYKAGAITAGVATSLAAVGAGVAFVAAAPAVLGGAAAVGTVAAITTVGAALVGVVKGNTADTLDKEAEKMQQATVKKTQ